MILAAGLGTRLRPLTEHAAKPSLPVANVPLIFFALQLLRSAGIKDVIINLHHAPETIKKIVGRGGKFGMKVQYSVEPVILGTGGAIKKAQDFFEDEDFVVVNGDIILELDLPAAIRMHREHDALATMVLRADKNAERYGIIGIDAENRLRRFTDLIRPADESGLQKLMFTGVHIFRPGIFEYLPPAIECCINHYAYPRMIENREAIYGYVQEGFWSDLGTLPAYFDTNLTMLRNPGLLSYFDPLAGYHHTPKREVDRVIRMGRHVNIHDNVKIIDPVILADQCTIGKGAVVGPNVILGNNCVVESGSRLEDAVLFSGTKTEEDEKLSRIIRSGKQTVFLGEESKGQLPRSEETRS